MWSFKHRPDANINTIWTRTSPLLRVLLECSMDSFRIFIFENWHTRHFPQQKRNQQHPICSRRKHHWDEVLKHIWMMADHKTLGSGIKISGFHQKYIDGIWINPPENSRFSTGWGFRVGISNTHRWLQRNKDPTCRQMRKRNFPWVLCLRHVRNKIVYHIFLTTSAGTLLPTTQLVQNVKLRELHHLPQKATGSLLPNQWENEDMKFSGILELAAHPILLCLCTPCRRQHNRVAINDMFSICPQSDIRHCAI